MKRQNLYFLLGLGVLAGFNAFASVTGMPWEPGVTQIGNSLTKSIAPTVAVAGGAFAVLDLHRHGGQLSTFGSGALYTALGGVAASLWPVAMSLIGVNAALV